MYAENNLNNTNNSLSTVLQQLSSGSKINSGADDAAGLSLVNGLQANQQALTQSQTNATEGVGLLQVADGALSQVTSLLNRAVTLATEASNGTLNSTQDLAANQEYQSILSEISNIGSTTTYNQEQVFNSNTNIYTGDSSSQGSSVSALNIRSLSASNVGDTSGTMAYSNGTNNVFIDLSSTSKNAAVTDTLGATTATTTVAVNYLSKGANGAAVTATANIAVGAGTTYANTAQGLISAINNSGLGLTASFGTAANGGTAAAATAVAANDANSALQSNANDTGIIISGAGVGVNNNSAAAGYTNGAGEVGTVTVSQASDTLGGTLNIVGSNGATHAITLGIANSTDTLTNLQATINAAGYGVTASTNTAQTTNGTGTHAAGTIMTLTSANSAVTVAGTNITDAQAAATTVTLTALVGAQTAAGAVAGTMSAASATDTLTGVLSFSAATGDAAGSVNLGGQTITQFMANAAQQGTINAAGMTATANAANTMVTFTQTATLALGSVVVTGTHSLLQDSAPTTGTAVVAQTNFLAIGTAGTLGTVSVSNANDTLTGGTLQLTGANGTQTLYTLGTAGTTDSLANLAKQINAATVTTAASETQCHGQFPGHGNDNYRRGRRRRRADAVLHRRNLDHTFADGDANHRQRRQFHHHGNVVFADIHSGSSIGVHRYAIRHSHHRHGEHYTRHRGYHFNAGNRQHDRTVADHQRRQLRNHGHAQLGGHGHDLCLGKLRRFQHYAHRHRGFGCHRHQCAPGLEHRKTKASPPPRTTASESAAQLRTPAPAPTPQPC